MSTINYEDSIIVLDQNSSGHSLEFIPSLVDDANDSTLSKEEQIPGIKLKIRSGCYAELSSMKIWGLYQYLNKIEHNHLDKISF